MNKHNEEAKRFAEQGGRLEDWQEEEVDVSVIKPIVDKEGKIRLDRVVKKEKQKVFYTQGKSEKLSCKDGDHYFVMIDKHKYIAKCKYCQLHRKIYPVTHNIVDGKIIEV